MYRLSVKTTRVKVLFGFGLNSACPKQNVDNTWPKT